MKFRSASRRLTAIALASVSAAAVTGGVAQAAPASTDAGQTAKTQVCDIFDCVSGVVNDAANAVAGLVANQPPAAQPPAAQPPAQPPAAEQPPAAQAPADKPPAQPPANQPPADHPPANQPPAQPPADQGLAQPPADQPPGRRRSASCW